VTAVTVSRRIAASADRLFNAWLDPASLAGRSLPRLEEAASAARAEGASVEIAVVDAMDQDAVDRHVDQVADAAGRVEHRPEHGGLRPRAGPGDRRHVARGLPAPGHGLPADELRDGEGGRAAHDPAGERRHPHDLYAGRAAHGQGLDRERGAERRARGVLARARRRARAGGRARGMRASACLVGCGGDVVHGRDVRAHRRGRRHAETSGSRWSTDPRRHRMLRAVDGEEVGSRDHAVALVSKRMRRGSAM